MGNNLRGESIPDDGLQVANLDENNAVNSQGTSGWPSVVTPSLTFHHVHGVNIQLLRGGRIAKRKESFCKGLAFSSRPIEIDEFVCIRFSEVVTNWSGVLRFGVTNVDPETFRGVALPKFACPDLTTKEGYWAKALPERYSVAGAILHFFVNADGELYYGMNGIQKGAFLVGINVRKPLWVIVDIYGNSSSLEFIGADEVRSRSNHISASRNRGAVRPMSAASSTTHASATGTAGASNSAQTHQRQLRGSSTTHQNLPLSAYHAGVQFSSLVFHSVRGKHISLTNGYKVAERHSGEYACGYVFTSRPIAINEKIVVQILDVEPAYTGSMAFGLTCCDPVTIQGSTLPIDSDDLLERAEYWVCIKDVAAQPKATDELSFWVTDKGEVYFAKNNLTPRIVIYVDISVKLWAYFDVYGTTQRIRLLGSVKVSNNASATGQRVPSLPNIPRRLLDLSPQPRIATGTSATEASASSMGIANDTAFDIDDFPSMLSRRTRSDTSGGETISASLAQLSTLNADRRVAAAVPTGTTSVPRPAFSLDGASSMFTNSALILDAVRRRGNEAQPPHHPQFPPPVPARVSPARVTPARPPRNPSVTPSLPNLQMQQQPATEEEPELGDECRICMNAKVNCVIYTCGHMSMCFECATETWHVNGECPICRRKIEDVIRTYKS